MKLLCLLIATTAVVIVEPVLAVLLEFAPALAFGVEFSRVVNSAGVYALAVMAISTLVVVTLGIPVYLLLEKRGGMSTGNLAKVGFAIPVVIYACFVLLNPLDEGFSSGQNYYGTYRSMVEHGELTLWGWIRMAEDTFRFGVHGLLGAVVFGWAFTRATQALVKPNQQMHADQPSAGR